MELANDVDLHARCADALILGWAVMAFQASRGDGSAGQAVLTPRYTSHIALPPQYRAFSAFVDSTLASTAQWTLGAAPLRR
jgi:hypothetical protein